MARIQTYTWYLLLLLTAVLALLPVAQLIHPMKWDIIDQAYPWRYFIGECLQEGMLPLWNPYQLLGSPIHADPQSSAWYPITWFFGYFFGYDIYLISIDYILHVFLAGMGMFFLAKKLDLSEETAFLAGVAYMLSGFFIGNAQHFMWIISGTWIPFIIGAFLQLRKEPSLRNSILMGLPFFMIMTGGYPAFIFITLYLLLLIFILFGYEDMREKAYGKLFRFAGYLGISAVFTILAGMVVITSVYHLPSAMTRGSGVTLTQALFGAFTPESFISFILPFASIREMEIYGTDLSMSNAYFGIIMLVFFLAGIMIRKTKLMNLMLFWGLFCLAASVGNALPVREFLYDYVPFMNLFRFPALFRVFFILSFIIISAYAYDKWRKDELKTQKIIISLSIVAALVTGFIIYSLAKGNLDFGNFLKDEAFNESGKSRIVQHILFQGIIQIILLIGFALLIFKWMPGKYARVALILLFSLDMMVASRLNGPYTVYSERFNSHEIYDHSKSYPDGFLLPGNRPVYENRDTKGIAFQALWRNLNIFRKEVSWEGYNPLHLKGFEEIADNHPKLFETILQNPLVYISGKISPTDTVAIKSFSPEKISVHCSTSGKALVNLLQNNYYGWKASIDGRPAEIITSNMSFISVPVPEGEHEVVFYYDPKAVKVGFWISLMTLTSCISLLLFLRVRKSFKAWV